MSSLLFLILIALWSIYQCAIQEVLYDFDETITVKHLYNKLYHLKGNSYDDQLYALNTLCDNNCLIGIFGGNDRISLLESHFKRLNDSHINIGIISFGYSNIIINALKRVQLLKYIPLKHIFGREIVMTVDHGLKRVNRHALKTICIKMHFKKIQAQNKLFLDDDIGNMEYAKSKHATTILDIDAIGKIKHGLSAAQLLWIENQCHVQNIYNAPRIFAFSHKEKY